MSPPGDAAAPEAGHFEGGNGNQVGATNHPGQCTAWPTRPALSDHAERILAQLKPADYRPKVVKSEQRPPRIGDVNVTGQLELKVPKSAMSWELRRTFSSLGSLPDGVTVIVRLRARQVVELADALGGLDDIPSINLVVTGPVHRFAQVAEAVAELRSSAARRAAELRAVAS